MSSSTVSNWKSDLPVQSLPTRSWSCVVWQILASLQSFAQIPHPPPRCHLQLLGIDAQCSYTRRDSAGYSRADGPEGSRHTVTLSLLAGGHWQKWTQARLLELDAKSHSCLWRLTWVSRIYLIPRTRGSVILHEPSSSFRQCCLRESAYTGCKGLTPTCSLHCWRRWKGNFQKGSHSSWSVCSLSGGLL